METQTEKLPLEFKQQWIAALRSGDYKQTMQGVLHLPVAGSYCCLGVACIVAGIPKEELIGKGFISGYIKGVEKVPTMLHGGNDKNGALYDFNEIPINLAEMNDEGNDFNTIADYIEENL